MNPASSTSSLGSERLTDPFTVPSSAAAHLVVQDYAAYTDDDHDVWGLLYDRRMRELRETGSEVFLRGAERIGLRRDRVPDLGDVNSRLAAVTGWRAVPVDGFLPAREFFTCLARKQFPTTVVVRPREKLEYIDAPDIFHDVFGHVPLHADPAFAAFLQRFGALASRARDEHTLTALTRVFWFTVEFGLIREHGTVKVYGSGLISSAADAANALGPKCERRPFSLEGVMKQPFEIDRLQDVLFVVDSFDDLFVALELVEEGSIVP